MKHTFLHSTDSLYTVYIACKCIVCSGLYIYCKIMTKKSFEDEQNHVNVICFNDYSLL